MIWEVSEVLELRELWELSQLTRLENRKVRMEEGEMLDEVALWFVDFKELRHAKP